MRLLAALVVLQIVGLVHAGDPFVLKEGDRVVLLGNTLIEREQRHGYWELALTSRFAERNILFRNLGWSGDTVFGEARASFGTPAEGFEKLKEQVAAVKPTMLLIGYGTNEAFEGKEGLPRFEKGLNTLLDALAIHKARIVLLSPLKHENLGPPLPDPKEQNANIRLYADVLRDVARKRGHGFVDLYDLLGNAPEAGEAPGLTDNGMHLTASGYRTAAAALEQGLGYSPRRWQIDLDLTTGKGKADGASLRAIDTEKRRFEVKADMLPYSTPGEAAAKGAGVEEGQVLKVKGLPPGEFALVIDGTRVARASAQQWEAGVSLRRGPSWEQAERLRTAILAKNRQFFHRWRPQNETYLFGFRKHEQGQNAREIPQFDPLVAEREQEIARLRMPTWHRYELISQAGEEK